MIARAALLAIHGYQRYLSPRKGYGCAYRLAYGGTGCSGFAKMALAEHGFIRSLPRIARRFADCKKAAQHLQTDADQDDQGDQPSKQRKSRWYECCDFTSCCDLRLCGRGGAGKADAGSDCTPDCCSL